MLNLLFLGQNWAKIYISTVAHTHNVPDNPLTRNGIYLLHKELFVFNFWRLSADTISKLEKTGQFFQVSIHFHPFHPWMQRIVSKE